MDSLPFMFEAPLSFFEKAGADPGKERRIAGIISTEQPDRQGEVILQRGLDFRDFIKNGWFNDNHSKSTTGMLGYPEEVKQFRKGERLPDGDIAKANTTWVEGYLLNDPDADKIWQKGMALQKTNRRLGYSIEGKIEKRQGPGGRIIAKAKVRNVAITNCPVNTDSRLEVLAKSLATIEHQELEKALGMGTATPGSPVMGAQSGMGAGRVITGQSLEQDDEPRDLLRPSRPRKRKTVQKALTDGEAVDFIRARMPSANLMAAGRIVELTKALKRQGRL